MTIKEPVDKADDKFHPRPSAPMLEPEFVLNANDTEDPPIAFANALDVSPPETVGTTTIADNSSAVATATAANDDNNAVAYATAAPSSSTNAANNPSTVVVVNNTTPNASGAPGLPPGGQWVSIKFVGPQTWLICGGVSVFTCVFCLLPCGVWAFCCPCDNKRAYLANGTVYDEHGRRLGPASQYNLR